MTSFALDATQCLLMAKAVDLIGFSASGFDAMRCLLMGDLIARLPSYARCIFWGTLPKRIPNLTAHLPGLTAAVLAETDSDREGVLKVLSFHPLPAVLSPETVAWRSALAAAWEKRLKQCQKAMKPGWITFWRYWENDYVTALRGLARVDSCGMPEGMTCPSLLPTLLDEARMLYKEFRAGFRAGEETLAKCLAALAEWRPAPNVKSHPAHLKEWADIWLQLYQQPKVCRKDHPEQDGLAAVKGIAAKALLNLLEVGDEHETGVPAGMEMVLLECLAVTINAIMDADDVKGSIRAYDPNILVLSLLGWEPRDVSRFPADRLPLHFTSRFTSRRPCDRKEILQIIWQIQTQLYCISVPGTNECISVPGTLARYGLTLENISAFQDGVLEAVKREKFPGLRLVLSLAKTGNDASGRMRRKLRSLWKKGLKSHDEATSCTSAVALLEPDPSKDLAARQQELRADLWMLPETIRPKLSTAKLAYLLGECPAENPNANPNTNPGRIWQFRPGETRFRISTEHIASTSTLGTVPATRPDRTAQRSVRSEPSPGVCY